MQEIETRIGQAGHMGKWESHAAMVRLVRELEAKLEDAGSPVNHTAVDNVVYSFMGSLPQKVADEVRHG